MLLRNHHRFPVAPARPGRRELLRDSVSANISHRRDHYAEPGHSKSTDSAVSSAAGAPACAPQKPRLSASTTPPAGLLNQWCILRGRAARDQLMRESHTALAPDSPITITMMTEPTTTTR